MDKDSQLRFSETNFNTTKQWVELADKKATFILTIALAIFTASLAIAPRLDQIISSHITSGYIKYIIFGAFLILLSVFYIFVTILALNYLVSVISPRAAPHSKRKSVLFFQTIATMEIQEFKDKILKFNKNDIVDELLDQTYNNSVVASQKFEKVRKAIICLKWAGLSGLILILIGIIL